MSDLDILLIEDDWSVRSAVGSYLRQRGFRVTEADSMVSALEASKHFQADAAVVDIVLPERSGETADFNRHTGVEIARQLRLANPSTGIVFLSAYFDRGPQVVEMFMEGHERIVYLLKGSRPQELYEAILHVASGHSGLEIAAGVQTQPNSPAALALSTLSETERLAVQEALPRIRNLTAPERRVFDLVGACNSRQQAAGLLKISPKTVSSHMDSVYACLNLANLPEGINHLALLAKIHLIHALETAGRGEQSSVSGGRP